MLIDRLRSSAVLIAILVALLYLDVTFVVEGAEGLWLFPLLLFTVIGTSLEIADGLRSAGHPVRRMVAVSGSTLIAVSAATPFLWAFSASDYPVDCPVGRLGWIMIGAVASVFLALIAEMREYNADAQKTPGASIRRTFAGVFVSMYVGLPLAMLAALRMMHAEETEGRFGLAAIITMIVVTKVTDVGAFFSGRTLGRNKMSPLLSPGKTVEGAVGGVLAATLAAYVCLAVLFPWLLQPVESATEIASDGSESSGITTLLGQPWVGALVLGPTLALTGMVGDLAESLFKRDLNVKDSGNLLPGLGGVWDVSDSLIATSMPAFFCFAAGVGGQ
jgi:phosphatidate cytidylyltransferase